MFASYIIGTYEICLKPTASVHLQRGSHVTLPSSTPSPSLGFLFLKQPQTGFILTHGHSGSSGGGQIMLICFINSINVHQVHYSFNIIFILKYNLISAEQLGSLFFPLKNLNSF